jgi:uncharacterized SAM-binding protein YcdF (DUF218 family)
MAAIDGIRSEPEVRPAPQVRGRPRRWLRPMAVVAALSGSLCVAFMAGFVSFVREVPTEERTEVGQAVGIVALTGGAERLADAISLLAKGRAGRLLITGVNPETSAEELTRRVPRFASFADCCVDLDYRAANTLGNAVETHGWVRQRGFRSLIVVTSGYHMPRALMELERLLPDVSLIPYPVVTPRLKDGAWWRDPAAARLMAAEYVKYLAASAKLRLGPAIDRLRPSHADAAIRL